MYVIFYYFYNVQRLFFSLKMWCLGLILLFATAALALFPGGRFLEDKPDPNLCAQSKFLVILSKLKVKLCFCLQ